MISKKNMMISFVITILVVLFSVFIFKRIFYYNYYKDVVLAENIIISSDWKEIESIGRIKIEKDNQFISIVLEPPLEPDTGKGGIKTPNGQVLNPEIKLVDADGEEYSFTYYGGRRTNDKVMANYKYKGILPLDKIYSKVRIRSDFPIKAKQILWSGYNTKDLP